MAAIRIGILGGSGYGGSELLRILLFHPAARVCLITANEQAGKRVDAVHPNLRGLTDLAFHATTMEHDWNSLDLLFLALPHGRSLEIVPQLPETLPVIDLAGDFRLSDPDLFERYYGKPHPALDVQATFIYGLSEINRSAVAKARRVANPGCFATAVLLALAPLVRRDALTGKIIVNASTGSSGSGVKPSPTTHHPRRSSSFFAYKCFAHQHLPEMEQVLRDLNGGFDQRLIFQSHSAPLVRGIFASAYCELKQPMKGEDIGAIFSEFYDRSPFVRLVEGSPDVNWVKNTNFADLGWAVEGNDLIVFSAIDNLVKGAAGQAIQNMNLMFGLKEETGILFAGSHP